MSNQNRATEQWRFVHVFSFLLFFLLFTSSPDESTVSHVRGFHVMYVCIQSSYTWKPHGRMCRVRENMVPLLALVRAFISLFRRHVRHVHKISLSCGRNPYSGGRQFRYSRGSTYEGEVWDNSDKMSDTISI